MKKILVGLALVLALATQALATPNFPLRENEGGLTVKYEPFAGIFERTFEAWSYTQETVLLGLYGHFWLDDNTTLMVESGVIPGSDELGQNIGLVGTATNIKLDVGGKIVLSYGLSYYWGGDKMSPLYQMSTGVVHRASAQIYLNFFPQTELR